MALDMPIKSICRQNERHLASGLMMASPHLYPPPSTAHSTVTPDSALTSLLLHLGFLCRLLRLGIFLLGGCAKDTNWSPLQVQGDMVELQKQGCQDCESPSKT